MKPVVDRLQPLVSFDEVNVKEIDLYDDAWGFYQMLPELAETLSVIEISPSDALIEDLLCKIEHSCR